jgi:Ca-activated chloride channel homolog
MKTALRLSSAVLMAVVLLLTTTVFAQQEAFQQEAFVNNSNDKANDKADASSDNVLKVDSELVLIDVTVLDKNRNFVPGLDKSSFHIYEDQVQQQIEIFSKESAPVSFGFVIDTSGSMRFKLKTVIESAKKLLELCRPGDEVFIVDMKDNLRIRFAQPFTTNFDEARAKLDKMYPSGGTALLDGIAAAGKYAQEHSSNRRRALIVMSDGDERDSTLKMEQLLDQVREMNLQVYLMGFPEGFINADGAFVETPRGKAKNLMKKIAEETGGQAFFPASLNEISPLTVKIGQELRSQYTMGYYPNGEDKAGQFHRLQVKLADKNQKFAVRTRNGYTSK